MQPGGAVSLNGPVLANPWPRSLCRGHVQIEAQMAPAQAAARAAQAPPVDGGRRVGYLPHAGRGQPDEKGRSSYLDELRGVSFHFWPRVLPPFPKAEGLSFPYRGGFPSVKDYLVAIPGQRGRLQMRVKS